MHARSEINVLVCSGTKQPNSSVIDQIRCVKSQNHKALHLRSKKKIVQVQRLANLKMIGSFVLILNMTWQPYNCVKYIQILLAYTPRTRVGPPSYYYILQIGDSF